MITWVTCLGIGVIVLGLFVIGYYNDWVVGIILLIISSIILYFDRRAVRIAEQFFEEELAKSGIPELKKKILDDINERDKQEINEEK